MTVYVKLLNEGTVVFRPVEAHQTNADEFELIPIKDYDSIDEDWEFPPGSIVRCKKQYLEGEEVLVAIAQI